MSADPSGWVHLIRPDAAGGLQWRPCPAGALPLRRGGVCLVTGASGALGRRVAAWLAHELGGKLILTGRRGLGPVADEVVALGARAVPLAGDLADAADRARLFAAIRAAAPALDAAFHLAGGPRGEALLAKTAPLEDLYALGPGHLVLFSSVAALMPGLAAGLEAYAEANRALDAFARAHHRPERAVISVAWAPWAGGGLSAGMEGAFRARGLDPVEPDLALAALGWALAAGQPQVAVVRRPDLGEGAALDPEAVRAEVRQAVADAVGLAAHEVDGAAPLTHLGLDSVAALDLLQDLEGRLGRALPTTLLYEHGTADAVADAILGGARRSAPPPEPAAPDLLPAQQVFAVQRAYFPEIPGNVLLSVAVRRAEGPALEREALAAALSALAARHPALSRAIRREDGALREVEGAPPALRWVDDLDEAAEHRRPFDLERGPALRVVTDGRRLLLDAPHALVDAWSLQNALEDLLLLHEAARRGEPIALPPLRATAAEARAALAAVDAPVDPAWAERFADPVPPVGLPWRAAPDAPPAGPRATFHALDPALTAAAREAAAAAAVTLPELVLALWLRLVWRWSGQHDLTVRVAHGNRAFRLPDADRIVGSFADSLPVRARLEPEEPLADLARRVRDELAWIAAHPGASAMALATHAERGAAGPVGLSPLGFSFPLRPAATAVGGIELADPRGASASGFTRLGLIAWVFDGRLCTSWNTLDSHLDPAVVEALVADWARHVGAELRSAPPPPPTLHGRILARCALHPERAAVDGLSYGQLARRSAALAAGLTGPRVAVFAEPGADAVVAVIAALRAGAAYVPLDPAWPDARVAEVLDRADCTATLTTADLAVRDGILRGPPVRVVGSEEAEDGPCAASDLAYVMFTSGTSGRPKGVVVRHAAALALQGWIGAMLGVTEADRFVQTSSLAFGGSMRQMFTPLLHGASIHPAPPGAKADPDALLAFLRERGITVFNAVPALWLRLMDAMARHAADWPLPAVRWVLLGGEAVPAAHVRRWWDRWGGRARLANVYGATESVVNATWFEVVRPPPPEQAHTPIGWPRQGCRVRLADPVDGVGELVISGLIAEGTLDPADEDGAFVDDPVLGRAWRSGDLARRDPSGALVYVGRRDSQVQVHGNRVELGEIEHVLCQHPGVAHAVVVQREDGRLHAAFEGGADPTALRAWLGARLPAFMVPHTWEVGGALPRTPAGKRDRRAVSAALPDAPAGELGPLAALWQEVLDLRDPPGPEDDFFALGGDSILLLDLLERLRARDGTAPPALALYGRATLAEMARLHRAEAASSSRSSEVGTVFPLTAVQRGFWYAHRAAPEHPPLWTATLPLRGEVDPDALAAALRWLVARHEMLRTRFGADLSQRVEPAARALLELDDLRALPPAARAEAVARRGAEQRALRLDLADPTLFRVRLCLLGPDEAALLVAAHHLLADAWSAWLLIGELLAAHDALAAGRAPALPPAPAFRHHLPGERPDHGAWRRELADLPALPPSAGATGHSAAIELAPAAWEGLREAARREGVSPFVRVLAAVGRAIGEVLGSDDVIVATALAGRDPSDAAAARVVGPYARGVPVRLRAPFSAVDAAEALSRAAAAADAPPSAIVDVVGVDAPARLGRFFLSWLDPSAVPAPPTAVQPRWRDGIYRFATASSGTEVFVGAVVDAGLAVHLHGGPRVEAVAAALRRHLAPPVGAALVVYAPNGVELPLRDPLVVETVSAPAGRSELVLLPRHAAELVEGPALDEAVRRALAATSAPVVALAGVLPARTGLAARPLARPGQVLTTGHAATVVAMVMTVQRALAATGRSWGDARVALLGYGAIGRAVRALATARLGEPAAWRIVDPALPGAVEGIGDADLVLGASSGGATLQPLRLAPGTIVVDDSFPRAFDDHAAILRMSTTRDALLVGGGLLDVGPLERHSPFPQAEALRARYGATWLPGCHAEALLLAARPELGPTVGIVDAARALAVWAAVEALGWSAPPLHLGAWVIPEHVLDGVRR